MVSLLAHLKIQAMFEEFTTTEFMAYLIGKSHNGDFAVEDIFVPEQKVTAASALAMEFPGGNNVLGTVHSHGRTSMTEFSGIDEKSILGNHNLNLLAVTGGRYNARVRQQLPCGYFGSMRATVVVITPDNVDLEAFLKDAKKKVEHKAFPPGWY